MESMQKMLKVMLLVLLTSLSGCASAPQAKVRYFWPPAPEVPRIEYIGTYSSQNDLDPKEMSWFDRIVGEEAPDTLLNPAFAAGTGDGRVLVSDLNKRGVMVFNFNTKEAHMLGGDAAVGLFKNPSGIAFDADGNIYAADLDQKKIFVFDKNERPLRTIDLSAAVKSVGFIAIDRGRKRIIVPDVRGDKVQIVDYYGKPIKTIEIFRKTDILNYPTSAAVAPNGNIVIADSMNARIVQFTPEGEFISIIGRRGDSLGDIAMVKAVAVDSEGHIYMTDVKSNRIQIYNDKGETLLALGRLSLDTRQVGVFYAPTGIYIDQNDAIYIVDKLAGRFHIYQYLNSQYIAQHPITSDVVVAEPRKETGKKGEEKGQATQKPVK